MVAVKKATPKDVKNTEVVAGAGPYPHMDILTYETTAAALAST